MRKTLFAVVLSVISLAILTGCSVPATATVIQTTFVTTTDIVTVLPPTTVTITPPATTITITPPVITQTQIVATTLTVPITITVTVSPIPAVITNSVNATDTWLASGRLYMLTTTNTNISDVYFQSLGFSAGMLGGGTPYIYSRLNLYWSDIQQSNTFILFNPTAEPLTNLNSWPSQYGEVCPFNVQQLTSMKLPFALLQRGSGGLIRAIVVANTDSDMKSFLVVMANQPVPVGIPWTISNNQIIAAN